MTTEANKEVVRHFYSALQQEDYARAAEFLSLIHISEPTRPY